MTFPVFSSPFGNRVATRILSRCHKLLSAGAKTERVGENICPSVSLYAAGLFLNLVCAIKAVENYLKNKEFKQMPEEKECVSFWKPDVVTCSIMLPYKYKLEFYCELEKFNSEIRKNSDSLYHIGCKEEQYNFLRKDVFVIELSFVEPDRSKVHAFLVKFCGERNLHFDKNKKE